MTFNTQQRRAYGEGLRAARAGMDTTACAYKPDSQSGVSWFNGYRKGKGLRPSFTPDPVDMAYEDMCADMCGPGL
jgi:hypothetical protein